MIWKGKVLFGCTITDVFLLFNKFNVIFCSIAYWGMVKLYQLKRNDLLFNTVYVYVFYF